MKTGSPKPMKHQLVSLKHGETTPIVFDTSDTGTGKTGVRIWAYDARRKRGKARKMLVLCTRTLMKAAWGTDIHKFAPHLKYVISTAGKHDKVFRMDADVYITNHDAVKWLAQQSQQFFAQFDELVIDESTAYKHHTSQRSKAVAQIAKHFRYISLLTATPNGNTITDVWHQAYILDGGKRLGRSFYKFRDSVCTPIQVGRDANAVKWEDKPGAEEAVFGLLSDIVIRHKREDCLDLPQNVQYSLTYELTPKQKALYDQLERTQILALAKEKKITAVSASAVATKLLQIASGAVYAETGEEYSKVDDGRYEFVLDLVAERPAALVFFLWKHQRDGLVAEAEKRKLRYGVMDGTTSDAMRAELVVRYQAGLLDVLFAHPATAGHGLTLTRGSSTIWTSPTYDLERFVQGSGRQNRIGQKNKTENIVIVAADTIEQKVYDKMLDKDARMTNLLDLMGSVVKEFK